MVTGIQTACHGYFRWLVYFLSLVNGLMLAIWQCHPGLRFLGPQLHLGVMVVNGLQPMCIHCVDWSAGLGPQTLAVLAADAVRKYLLQQLCQVESAAADTAIMVGPLQKEPWNFI